MPDAPRPEEFSGDAIRRSVLRQTLRHPLTLVPTGLAAATAVGGAVVGAPAVALGASVILGSLGVGAWAVNYFMRPEQFADKYVSRLEARQSAARKDHVQDLRTEMMALGSSEGVKAWEELLSAHTEFQKALEKREQAGVALDVSTLRDLAERTRVEGLGHLGAYVATLRALKVIDKDKLAPEADALRLRIGAVEGGKVGEEQARLVEALKGQLEAIEERLRQHDEAQLRLEEILAACERCEAVLETGALNLGTMREVTARFVEDASRKLEDTIRAAHDFNQNIGRKDDSADRIYDRETK